LGIITKEIDSPPEQIFQIAREFLIAKKTVIDEDLKPIKLKAAHGSLFATSKENFTKKITIEIRKKSDTKSEITIDVSFKHLNFILLIGWILFFFTGFPHLFTLNANTIIPIITGIGWIIINIWALTGRNKFELDFLNYVDAKLA